MARYTIAVFAGHDDDTWETKGAKGIRTDLEADGVYEEYDTNIIIARGVVERLSEAPEIKVLFPQYKGRDMTLSERVAYCERNNVDTALFIHSNASSSRKATGAAAFYWHNSPDGKRFANHYRNEMKKLGFPLWSDGTYPCQSSGWSNFYVVRNTTMPVLLTENFFFTNRSDLEKYLLDPGNREKIMDVHAKAVCHYFGVKYPRKKEKPKKKPEKVEPKEEEIEMLKEAIVINGYADFPAAEGLANRLDCPMYTKASIRGEVAEHLLLIGISDKSDYKADKITVLAGDDRYDTAENVKEYIDKL